MARRSFWLSIFVVVSLVLQSALPVLSVAALPIVVSAEARAQDAVGVEVKAEDTLPLTPILPVTPTVPVTPTLPVTLTSPVTPPLAITPTGPAAAPALAPGAPPLNLNLNLELSLSLDPPWAAPGDGVTATVTARNPAAVPLPGLTLTTALPAGLLYVAQSGVGFAADPRRQELTWPAGDLHAGAVITGSFQARVQGLALGEMITDTVTATSPALAAAVTATSPALAAAVTAAATLEVVAPRNDEAWVTPEAGGQLRSADDRLLLRVPPGAVTGRTRFRYAVRPAADLPQPLAGLCYAFTVDAQDEGGQMQHAFAMPLALTLRYAAGDFPAGAGQPILYYFDEAAGQWVALPTEVTRAARQLRVAVPHLTLFAAATGGTFVPEVMPSIRGVQSDLFSGSVSIAYPLALPPGRGGLAPELSLQFNSQSRQGDPGNSSVVGTGWKLSADSFVYATPFLAGSPPPTWRLAGAAFSEGGSGSTGWYFREAPQWRVVKPAGDNGALDAYAPDGTRYHFEPALHDWYNGGASVRTDKWVLQYERDPVGNQIDYVYDSALPVNPTDVRNNPNNYADALGPRYRYFDDGNFGVYYLTQINLQQIRYNGGQTVVDFTYAARADAPAPFCTQYNSLSAPGDYAAYWGQFTTRLLTGIRVRQGGQLVAGYKLTYDQWGNAATCANWARYALQAIARCSDESLTNCLPATSLTNAPQEDKKNGTVTRYDNGYGGQVAFGYGADGVLATRTVTDTVTGTANQWGYSYTDKLLDGWTTVGYAQVTETLPSSLGAGNTVYHHFSNGNGADVGFRGKEDVQRVTVGGVTQQEVARTWTGTTAGVYGGAKLVYLSQAVQTTYDKDGLNPLARKTEYFYDLDHQGNGQYGNLTRIKEYSDSATLYRTTERWYYPKVDLAAGKYIVNRPGQEKLWDASAVCQGQSRTLYDTTGLTAYQTPPTQGLVKEVWQAKVCDSASQSDWMRTTLNGYDNYGNLNSATAASEAVTTTTYDGTCATYPLSVTVTPGPGGGVALTTSYAYYGINPESGGSGLTGQLQKKTDPNNAVTRYRYDAFGRAQELRQPGAAFGNPATEKLTYTDAAPYSVKHSLRDDANGDANNTATYLDDYTFYDGLGQVVQTQAEVENSSQSAVVSQQYNALGAVIGATAPYTGTAPGVYQPFNWTSPSQPVTRTAYDGWGRVTQVTPPDGSVVKTFYNGRRTATLDAPGHQTLQEVDAFGRLIYSRQYNAVYSVPNWSAPVYAQAQYQYNVRDALEQVTGPDGAVTDPTYNRLGQKTQMSDPDLGVWSYTYDGAGNLQTQTDARGCVITFNYDGHSRLSGKSYSGPPACSSTPAISYTYDAFDGVNQFGKGRRTGLTDGSGSASWIYDQRGRVKQESKTINGTGGGTFVTQWDYDSADRPKFQKYPGDNAGQLGEQVNFAYTAQGLLDTVSGTTAYVGDTQYNVRGQVTERRLGSPTGVVRQLYAYTAAENFRLVRLQAGNATPYSNLQNLNYTYDDNGNVLTITDAAAYGGSQTQTFSYDPLDRLQTAQASGTTALGGYASQPFNYDPAGNLTHFASATQNQYYLDAAHKHALTHIGGTASGNQKYWYDANGNATKRITDATYDLTYDAENRLTQLQKNGAVSGTYVYDGDGNRVKETAGSVTTVYIGNTFEWSGSTATMKSYYYAGGTRVAMRTGTSAGTVNYLLGDHLGSQALTLTSAGARLSPNKELRYYPYGVARYDTNNQITSFNFTGQRKDSGSGLLFYDARWYDPQVGRFLSPDTIVPEPGNPQALNRYSYTLNNPLKYTDPSGHWVESALDIAFIGYDIYDIKTNGLTWTSGLSLAADVGGLLLPVVTGGGLLVRGLTHADDIAKAVSHVDDIAKAVSHADDVAKVTSHADDVVKAASYADDAADVAKLNPKGGIYTLRDVEGNVQRSGRTKDLARREVEHGTAYPDLRFQPEFRSDSYQVQRGGEQILHDRYNPPLDKINPISPRNPRRTQYLDAARKAGMQ